jgi:hypothetical protein
MRTLFTILCFAGAAGLALYAPLLPALAGSFSIAAFNLTLYTT